MTRRYQTFRPITLTVEIDWICFLALVPYRVLRMRLKARDSQISPERALEIMRRIQFHQITLHQRQSASGLSTMTPEQKDLFETIELLEPSAKSL